MGALGSFDRDLTLWINGFAGQNALVDAWVLDVSGNPIYKGVVVAMVLVGLWAWRPGALDRVREGVIATLLISVAAIVVGRVLAKTLPFSLRPIHTPDVPVTLPFGMPADKLDGWSSLPSDHAVMFFALATSVFLISRWAGALLFLHALLVISLPRVYLGLHWASDILVGAMTGAAVALALHAVLTRQLASFNTAGLIERHAALTYPILFFVLVQIGTMFDPVRRAASLLLRTLGAAFAGT